MMDVAPLKSRTRLLVVDDIDAIWKAEAKANQLLQVGERNKTAKDGAETVRYPYIAYPFGCDV